MLGNSPAVSVLQINRTRPAVTGKRQRVTTQDEVSRKNGKKSLRKNDATDARAEGHVARRCEASSRDHSEPETSGARAILAALPRRSSAGRTCSGSRFADVDESEGPVRTKCLLCF